MSEQNKRIRRLLFHPGNGSSDPEYSLLVASEILGRKFEKPSDLNDLSEEEANKLEEGWRQRFQSSFATIVKSL